MKGECKGLETSWFSSSQRQNSCAWVAKLWSLWNYKIKKRFEPAGCISWNNFFVSAGNLQNRSWTRPQTRPTCMAAKKFSIKILNRQSFVRKLHTALRREFRWRFGQKSNWTDGKRSKISTYFVRSSLWCVSQEHSWLEDRMEGKALRVQLERRVDSCWSWVVCFSSFIVQFLILGTHNSFGSFFVALLEEFQRSEAETGKENLYFLPQTKLARK